MSAIHIHSQCVPSHSQSQDDHYCGRNKAYYGRDKHRMSNEWKWIPLPTYWQAEGSIFIIVKTIGTLKSIGSCVA